MEIYLSPMEIDISIYLYQYLSIYLSPMERMRERERTILLPLRPQSL